MCDCRRLQAVDLLAPTCTQLILYLRCKVFSRYNVRTVLCTQKIFTFNHAWLYCSGLLLPGCCHDVLLVPNRLLLPCKLVQLLRVPNRKIFYGDEVSLH